MATPASRVVLERHTPVLKSSSALAARSRWIPLEARNVLPHEWIFGTFLLLTGLRLYAQGGEARMWSMLFLWCVAAAVWVFAWAEQCPTPWRWRVRLLFYPAAMGISFYALGMVVPLLGCPKVDSLLLGWDRTLFGETPAMNWERLMNPWLEDVAMAGYLFFFYYLIAGPAHYCVKDLRLFRKCIVGLFTMYGLAFMVYTVMPAAGPHLYLHFNTPLHGPLLVDWTLKSVNNGSNGVDAFPSVHVAAALYLLFFDWKHWRQRFWWVLIPCVVLVFSTVYLRFHYVVDALAAIPVALAGWWMAEKYEASHATERKPLALDTESARELIPN